MKQLLALVLLLGMINPVMATSQFLNEEKAARTNSISNVTPAISLKILNPRQYKDRSKRNILREGKRKSQQEQGIETGLISLSDFCCNLTPKCKDLFTINTKNFFQFLKTLEIKEIIDLEKMNFIKSQNIVKGQNAYLLEKLSRSLYFPPRLQFLVLPSHLFLPYGPRDQLCKVLRSLSKLPQDVTLHTNCLRLKLDCANCRSEYVKSLAKLLEEGKISFSQFFLDIPSNPFYQYRPVSPCISHIPKKIFHLEQNQRLKEISITLPTFLVESLTNLKFPWTLEKLSIVINHMEPNFSEKKYEVSEIFLHKKKPWKLGIFSDFRCHPDLEDYMIHDLVAYLERKTPPSTLFSLFIPKEPLITKKEVIVAFILSLQSAFAVFLGVVLPVS